MPRKKPIQQSRTVWINGLTMIAAVLMLIPNFLTDIGMPEHTAMKVSAFVMLLNNTITIYLRIFSGQTENPS